MIPVQVQPEPDEFDKKVRQPGVTWFEKNKISLDEPLKRKMEVPNYWKEASNSLWIAYQKICAYSCIYMDKVAGDATVDHFKPKKDFPRFCYEWDNYRLSCLPVNRSKGVKEILDPFEIEQGTFYLSFVDGSIYPNPSLSEEISKIAKKTIAALKLDNTAHRNMRLEHFFDFQTREVSADYLRKKSPFVWFEAKRQGFLDDPKNEEPLPGISPTSSAGLSETENDITSQSGEIKTQGVPRLFIICSDKCRNSEHWRIQFLKNLQTFFPKLITNLDNPPIHLSLSAWNKTAYEEADHIIIAISSAWTEQTPPLKKDPLSNLEIEGLISFSKKSPQLLEKTILLQSDNHSIESIFPELSHCHTFLIPTQTKNAFEHLGGLVVNEKHLVPLNSLLLELMPSSNVEQESGFKALTPIPRNTGVIVGRTKELQAIYDSFQVTSSVLLLKGIGGIGKTVTAREYIAQYGHHYQICAWIDFDTNWQESLVTAFPQMEQHGTIGESYRSLILELQNLPGKKLMVVDNFSDTKRQHEITKVLNNWHLLITSRQLMNFSTIMIDELPLEQAIELFHHYHPSPVDLEEQKELIELVGYHTLMIEMSAKMLHNSFVGSVVELVHLFNDIDYQNPLFSVNIPVEHTVEDQGFIPQLEALFSMSELNPSELFLLQRFALFPSQPIKKTEILDLFAIPIEEYIEQGNQINSLLKKGWIQQVDGGYHCHQVIRSYILYKAPPQFIDHQAVITKFIHKLEVQPRENPIGKAVWLPKAKSLAHLFESQDENQIAELLRSIAVIERDLGRYPEALRSALRCIQIQEVVLPPDHSSLATSYNNISLIFQGLRKLEKALYFASKVVNIQEQSLDSKHPDLAISYNNIVLIHFHLGQPEKALEFAKKSIEIREEILDPKHPDLAMSYNNICIIYRNLGQLDRALKFSKNAIEIDEEILDPKHPSLATSYKNISSIYLSLGQLKRALEFVKKAIAIQEEILEPKHPDLATSYNNICLIYQDLGQPEMALEFAKKAIEIDKETLDPKHHYLATSYNNISCIYRDLGQLEVALEFAKKAIEIEEEILNSKHPSLSTCYNSICAIYQNLDQPKKALEFAKKAIEIDEEILDPKHPDLAMSYNNMCLVYRNLGQLGIALGFAKKAIEIQEEILDPRHPSLAMSYNNICLIYRELDQLESALEYSQKALDIQEQVQDINHPQRASCYNNISLIFKELGQLEKALEFINSAIKILEANFPKGHPHLDSSRNTKREIESKLKKES